MKDIITDSDVSCHAGASINGRILLNDPAEDVLGNTTDLRLSFEFFPPKNLVSGFNLFQSISDLAGYDPTFISVTYGAGGSQNHLSAEAIRAINQHFDIPVMAHLVAARQPAEQVLEDADRFAELGVKDVLALRGDMDSPEQAFKPHPQGFASSVALIKALASKGWRSIRTTAYPDPHPNSVSIADDIDWLKAKFDAGATEAITQFFFDCESYLRLRDVCQRAGIERKITPGILAFDNWADVKSFSQKCGVHIPAELDAEFSCARDKETRDILCVAVLTDLCLKLKSEGVTDFHFYTLNKSKIVRDVLQLLGYHPSEQAVKAA